MIRIMLCDYEIKMPYGPWILLDDGLPTDGNERTRCQVTIGSSKRHHVPCTELGDPCQRLLSVKYIIGHE